MQYCVRANKAFAKNHRNLFSGNNRTRLFHKTSLAKQQANNDAAQFDEISKQVDLLLKNQDNKQHFALHETNYTKVKSLITGEPIAQKTVNEKEALANIAKAKQIQATKQKLQQISSILSANAPLVKEYADKNSSDIEKQVNAHVERLAKELPVDYFNKVFFDARVENQNLKEALEQHAEVLNMPLDTLVKRAKRVQDSQRLYNELIRDNFKREQANMQKESEQDLQQFLEEKKADLTDGSYLEDIEFFNKQVEDDTLLHPYEEAVEEFEGEEEEEEGEVAEDEMLTAKAEKHDEQISDEQISDDVLEDDLLEGGDKEDSLFDELLYNAEGESEHKLESVEDYLSLLLRQRLANADRQALHNAMAKAIDMREYQMKRMAKDDKDIAMAEASSQLMRESLAQHINEMPLEQDLAGADLGELTVDVNSNIEHRQLRNAAEWLYTLDKELEEAIAQNKVELPAELTGEEPVYADPFILAVSGINRVANKSCKQSALKPHVKLYNDFLKHATPDLTVDPYLGTRAAMQQAIDERQAYIRDQIGIKTGRRGRSPITINGVTDEFMFNFAQDMKDGKITSDEVHEALEKVGMQHEKFQTEFAFKLTWEERLDKNRVNNERYRTKREKEKRQSRSERRRILVQRLDNTMRSFAWIRTNYKSFLSK